MERTERCIGKVIRSVFILLAVFCFSTMTSASTGYLSQKTKTMVSGVKDKLTIVGDGKCEYWGSYNWDIVGLTSRTERSAVLIPYRSGNTTVFARMKDGRILRCRIRVNDIPLIKEK